MPFLQPIQRSAVVSSKNLLRVVAALKLDDAVWCGRCPPVPWRCIWQAKTRRRAVYAGKLIPAHAGMVAQATGPVMLTSFAPLWDGREGSDVLKIGPSDW